jgi:hypothetical protein
MAQIKIGSQNLNNIFNKKYKENPDSVLSTAKFIVDNVRLSREFALQKKKGLS